MKLFLVRHGQTTDNARRIIMGQRPGKLSQVGVKQAKLLAKHFRDYKFDVIFCSDLKRTSDTLKEIKKYHPNTPIIYAKEIRETHFGEFQGKKRENISFADLPGTLMTRRPKGGESIKEVSQRVKKFLDFLRKNHRQDKILIVSHGGIIRRILALLQNIQGEKVFDIPKSDNAGICEISLTPKKTIIHCINKTDHLIIKANRSKK